MILDSAKITIGLWMLRVEPSLSKMGTHVHIVSTQTPSLILGSVVVSVHWIQTKP